MVLNRALRREFSQTAAAVFVALLAILVTTVLVRLLGQAAGGRVPPDAVLAMIGLGALAQLPLVLSLSVFVAILVSLSRAWRDSEMVVWAASGVPLTYFFRPILQFVVPFLLVSALGTLYLSPWAHLKSAEYQANLESRDDTTRVAPGIFRESSSAGRVFFVEAGDAADGKLRNVFVSSSRDDLVDVVVAEKGSLTTDANGARFVVLEQGRRFEGKPGALDCRVLEFERYTVQVGEPKIISPLAKLRTIPTATLLAEPTPRHLGELSSRISAPLSGLMLALLALPLSYVNPRGGRAHGLILAVLAYLVYSNLINVFQAWIGQERMSFALGTLLPHLAAALLLFWLVDRRIHFDPFWRRLTRS